MKYDNQLRYAAKIIEVYKAEMPLHSWLKLFFRQHKQMGSKDRKQVGEMVYCFYRLGYAFKELSIQEKILIGIFLCNSVTNQVLDYFKPSWNENIGLDIEKKLLLLQLPATASLTSAGSQLLHIFPWKDELSSGVDHIAFCKSFLQQPDLFIRIRPGFEKRVKEKLKKAFISFKEINASSLALANGTKLDGVVELNREIVVQDLSSQGTASLYDVIANTPEDEPLQVWDCCAASGGKSIMLYDGHPNVDLTVSDIRESILVNLKKRFKEAGIKNYKSFITDLTTDYRLPAPDSRYDLIIADLPCSGSGTWSRTPESLYFFDIKETDRYSSLQKKIISNLIPHLKKGGTLIYITCSVFKMENESIVDFIQQRFPLKTRDIQFYNGYDQRADSMFAARFIG